MKKNILTSIIIAIILLNSVAHVSWAKVQDTRSASPSATPSSEASPETTQKLKERIEKIVDEKRDQVQGTVDDLAQQKRGFIGEVQRVTQEAVTVKTRKGTQILPITSEVQLVKAGKSIDVSAIAVGDWVVVIGTIESDTFTPRRIIVAGQSLRPRDHVVALGAITAINTKELTILTRQGEELTFTLNTKTKYQDQDAAKADLKKFNKDMQVLVVGYSSSEGKFATTIRAVVPLELLEDNE